MIGYSNIATNKSNPNYPRPHILLNLNPTISAQPLLQPLLRKLFASPSFFSSTRVGVHNILKITHVETQRSIPARYSTPSVSVTGAYPAVGSIFG